MKSLGNPNRNVALGTLQSIEPEYKVEGVHLGNQFWAVRVDATLAKSDQLIRPLKKVNIIGHAAGLIIAWPSTFVCCSSSNFAALNHIFSTITY